MKKIFGVVGHKGKLGSLLIQRADFVPVECDVTNIAEIVGAVQGEGFDVIVNCAAISSIDECEKDYKKALEVNKGGLENLHRAFGSRVLNLSSDHVFSGKSFFSPSEDRTPSPISAYGYSKYGAEVVSEVFGGKTIRLSRTVSLQDVDISSYLHHIIDGYSVSVPTFFHRNYIHREFALDGIEHMVHNWDSIKSPIVHYASQDIFSMYLFMYALVGALGLNPKLVLPRDEYLFEAPRPKRGGLRTNLASKLGFPMYKIADTVSRLVEDFNGH